MGNNIQANWYRHITIIIMDVQRGSVRSHGEAIGIGCHRDGYIRTVRYNHPGAIWQRQPVRIRTLNSSCPV